MLEYALIISLTVLFIHVMTWEGMIAETAANMLDDFLPSYIKKPLYGCPICMTPWYGALILSVGISTGDIAAMTMFQIVVTLCAAAGISAVLINVVSLCNDYVINVRQILPKEAINEREDL